MVMGAVGAAMLQWNKVAGSVEIIVCVQGSQNSEPPCGCNWFMDKGPDHHELEKRLQSPETSLTESHSVVLRIAIAFFFHFSAELDGC